MGGGARWMLIQSESDLQVSFDRPCNIQPLGLYAGPTPQPNPVYFSLFQFPSLLSLSLSERDPLLQSSVKKHTFLHLSNCIISSLHVVRTGCTTMWLFDSPPSSLLQRMNYFSTIWQLNMRFLRHGNESNGTHCWLGRRCKSFRRQWRGYGRIRNGAFSVQYKNYEGTRHAPCWIKIEIQHFKLNK